MLRRGLVTGRYLLFAVMIPLSFEAVHVFAQQQSVPASHDSPTPSAASGIPSDKIRLPEGTRVQLMLLQTISSKTAKQGDAVELQVLEPVKVDGVVIIAQRAPAKATIAAVHPAQRGWHAGNLSLRVDSVILVDQQELNVLGQTKTKGESTQPDLGAVGLLPFAPIILPIEAMAHGKDAVLLKGTAFSVRTTQDVLLDRALIEASQPTTGVETAATDSVSPQFREVDSSTYRVGITTREQVVQDWANGDTHVDTPLLLVAKSVPDASPMAFQGWRYFFAEFDNKGIFQKGFFVRSDHLEHELATFVLQTPLPPINLSDPIKLQATYTSRSFSANYQSSGTIRLSSESIEFCTNPKSENSCLRVAPNQLKKFHRHFDPVRMSSTGQTLEFYGKPGGKSHVEFELSGPADYFTLLRYLRLVAPSTL